MFGSQTKMFAKHTAYVKRVAYNMCCMFFISRNFPGNIVINMPVIVIIRPSREGSRTRVPHNKVVMA
jgi:hypothetical protein